MNRVKQILYSKVGIDKAIGYANSSRIIQAVGSVVSLSLIALFLTKKDQIFFELGLNGINTQYVVQGTAHISTYDIL